MWANAQRDGRPAEYRWHPVFNVAEFGSRPLLDCRAVKAKFHYTSWFGASSEPASVMEFGREPASSC